jgi:hypothetical protein
MTTGNSDGDIEFSFDGGVPPVIPEGEYEAAFVRADRKRMYGTGERLFLWFRLITPGQWFGIELYVVCTVAAKGKWRPSHKFFQAWILAAGKSPCRNDRMSTKVFRGKVFRVRVRTVTKTAKRDTRTLAQQYSVIDEILAVVAGSGCQGIAV